MAGRRSSATFRFALAKSEILAIVGKNGMGKTSLLKTILGFLPAWRGTIRSTDTTSPACRRI